MLMSHELPNLTALVKEGFQYWENCKGSKPIPSWSDISPAEIKHLLPSIVVTHVLQDPLDFVERITGEKILERSRVNSMGKNWRDYPGREPGSQIWSVFEKVVITGQPNFNFIPYIGPHKEFIKVVTAICPISDNGKDINKLIAFVDFVSQSESEHIEAIENATSLAELRL